MNAIVGHNPLPKGGVTLLFAVWISGALAISLARERRPAAVRALFSVPVLLSFLLLGLMILGLNISNDLTYGSTKLQLYVADNIILLLGAVVVATRRTEFKLFLYLTYAITVLVAVIMDIKLTSGAAVATVGGRFSLTATEYPIYLGRTAANGVLIATYVIFTAATTRMRTAAMLTLPLLLAALLAAGSRGPVVALVFGFVVFLVLAATNRRVRHRVLPTIAGLIVTVIVAPFVVPGTVITRSLSAIVGSASGLSSNGRFGLWSQAFINFEHHPWLGVGTGGFAALNAFNPYPHNIFLEVAVELGIIGLLVFSALMVSFLGRILVMWRHASDVGKMDAAIVLALFITATINALVSGAIQDNHEIWLWGGVGVGLSAGVFASRDALIDRWQRRLAPYHAPLRHRTVGGPRIVPRASRGQ